MNLHEVMNEVVLQKYCHDLRAFSFAEYLKTFVRPDSGGRIVQTFVSHWWGEEFCNLISSLQRFAESECIKRQALRLWASFHAVAILIVNAFLSKRLAKVYGAHLENLRGIDICVVILCNSAVSFCTLLLMLLEATCRRRQALEWSFWICAFANNQYELEHALGGTVDQSSFAIALRSDFLKSMVCVIDSDCTIYKRLWCTFELFYATYVLPRGGENFQKKRLPIDFVNADGIISQGGLSQQVLFDIKSAITQVKSKEAKASKAEDERQIHDFIAKSTTHESLDMTLKEITKLGLDSAGLRRRVPLIFYFFAPVASFTLSGTMHWLLLACHEPDRRFRSFLQFTAATYAFLSMAAISVILVLCFSSFEIKWKKSALSGPEGGSTPNLTPNSSHFSDAPQDDGWCTPNVKEFRVRISLPSSYTRLQIRVFAKAITYTFVLAGPGFLLAPPLLCVERFDSNDSRIARGWLQFLLNLRSLWISVQITYACAGLCAGIMYFLVRDSERYTAKAFRGILEDVWL